MSGGLRSVLVDLHVHTVVSPCAEVEMIPPLIVRRALELGLSIIAVTDHNTADNVAAVQRAAEGTNLAVLAGMEVQTREDAHILCLFDTAEQALAWQGVVYAHLPDMPNNEEVFGAQFVVDEMGEFMHKNERLLLTATSLSPEQVVSGVRSLGGIAIAAHIDRQAFSLLMSLGFLPPGLQLSAVEISRHTTPEAVLARYPSLRGMPIIASGDAHRLAEMCAHTLVTLRSPSVRELELALRGEGGRAVEYMPR
ncbi:MAG: PHP domain-containing protein [Chloroflexi bacterium]|nr:PHP domain-containing protein [Chloroflexota bacterium]